MNKKTYVLIVGVAVLLLAAGFTVFMTDHRPKPMPKLAECTLKNASPDLKISKSDERNLSIAASYIDNIPAGTHYDVNVKSYSGTTAAGSTVYAGAYGSYNFTAKKDVSIKEPSNQINWVITSFVPCKR
ncbi:MAG TPA: hypothetical protein VGM08_00360 [Candidatus Saccharimonadales bacterium]